MVTSGMWMAKPILENARVPVATIDKRIHDHASVPATLRRVFDFLGVDNSAAPQEASVFEHDYNEKMDPELRSRLIDIFRFDIKELERLLKRDLSAWTAR